MISTETPTALLAPEQVAAWLGVEIETLAAWRCRGGGPPFIKLHSRIRYERPAVECWLAARTCTTAGDGKRRRAQPGGDAE